MDAPQPIFLLPLEVEALTGFKSTTRQARWLAQSGWRFVINGGGRPVIARRYAEKMLGCGGNDDGRVAPSPNFAALLRAV